MIELVAGGVVLYNMLKKDAKPPAGVPIEEWTRFDHLFQKYGVDNGVDPTWLKAIALNESNLGRYPSVAHGLEFPYDVETSKSTDGLSWGLMQVTLSTARDMDPYATPAKLNDPEYSVRLAALYVSKLKKMFQNLAAEARFTEYVIKSYNQGPGNTKKEIAGGKGYANEYWARFQRNLQVVRGG